MYFLSLGVNGLNRDMLRPNGTVGLIQTCIFSNLTLRNVSKDFLAFCRSPGLGFTSFTG